MISRTLNKIKVLEMRTIAMVMFVVGVVSLSVGITATLLFVNYVSPVCKYSEPNYKCVNNIIEPDKCQKIEGGTNTINLN